MIVTIRETTMRYITQDPLKQSRIVIPRPHGNVFRAKPKKQNTKPL